MSLGFYVYALCDQTGKPFYIGKGKGIRAQTHARLALTGHMNYVCKKIRSIWEAGGSIQEQKLWDALNEEDAFFLERFAIATLGRENLTNLTDGGEGSSGYSHTPEGRSGISASNKRRTMSAEARRRIAKAQTGKHVSEETRARMSAAASARSHREPLSAETKKKIALAHTGRHASEETRSKMSESRKRYIAGRASN